VQIFRSEDGDGGFDICVLTADNKISLIIRTEGAYADGTQGRYKVVEEFPIEGEFLQNDQDRDDNRYTFVMS
jgi:hypothetical protein